MKKMQTLALTLALVALVSVSWASINLNSSRSNIYRIIFPDAVMKQVQAKAVLVEIDKIGPANEATVRDWLARNLKRLGAQTDRIKEIVVVPAAKTRDHLIAIALLTNAAGEHAALKDACPECALARRPPSQ